MSPRLDSREGRRPVGVPRSNDTADLTVEPFDTAVNPFDHRDLVVFDLDGTLIDSIGVWNEVDYKPGADVLVRRLSARGIRLAIASTTRRPNLEIYLSRNQNIRNGGRPHP